MTDGLKRESNGRFAKGNTGGPGRPVGSETALARFKANVSDEDLIEITSALVERAKVSDTSARLLFNYLFGLPRQAIDIDADVTTNVAYGEALARVTGTVDQDSEKGGVS